MFLHVTELRDVSAFELSLEFSDGVVKRVDLSGELHGEGETHVSLTDDGDPGRLAFDAVQKKYALD